MENSIDNFAQLEERTLALADAYRSLLADHENLTLELREKEAEVVELKSLLDGKKQLFHEVESRMASLLVTIDSCLPTSKDMPDEAATERLTGGAAQVLPGMHD